MTDIEVKEEASSISPAMMLNTALQKGIDPDRLGKLMEIYERYESDKDTKALLRRLAEAKKKFTPIKRTKKAHNYCYAPLETIIEATESHLLEQELVVTFHESESESGNAIKTIARLSYGRASIESAHVSPIDHSDGDKRMNIAQAYGSASTYAKRYAYSNLLAVQIEDDDDARSVPNALGQAASMDGQPVQTQAPARNGKSEEYVATEFYVPARYWAAKDDSEFTSGAKKNAPTKEQRLELLGAKYAGVKKVGNAYYISVPASKLEEFVKYLDLQQEAQLI